MIGPLVTVIALCWTCSGMPMLLSYCGLLTLLSRYPARADQNIRLTSVGLLLMLNMPHSTVAFFLLLLLTHVQLGVHQDAQSFFCKTAFQSISPHCLLMHRVNPPHTHGCRLSGTIGLCTSSLFKCSLTWSSLLGQVFLAPDYPSGIA